jgi:NADPH:quinone reductase-like Zn-dependent oxidoreductase
MKAITYHRYGSPDVLELEEIPKPVPGDDEVLVKIHAATVGTWDCEGRSFNFPLWFWLPLRIAMGIRRPRWPVLGQDLSGEIEAVGKDVTRFKVGDAIFASTGLGFGAHAEYKCLRARGPIALKPVNMSFEEAATIPTGGDNALHFLRMAEVQPGESVLINGAGANIGVIAVQIAKHYGAEVTAVDSTEKLDTLRAIGADHVIDYTQEDFTASSKTYDVIFDMVHGSSYSRCLDRVNPNGRYLLGNPRFGSMLRAIWTSKTTNRKVKFAFAASKQRDLVALRELIEADQIRAVIDRRYPLARAAEAHAYVDTGRRKGAVVLTIAEAESEV